MKNKTILPLILPLCAFPAPSVLAQNFAEISGSLIKGSPAIAADSVSAIGELSRMHSRNLPAGPSLEFEHLWNASGGHNRWSAAISQELMWPGAYASADRLESATDRMLRDQSRSYRRQTAAEAESMLIALAAGEAKIETQRRICANLDSLMQHYEKAFRSGEATILDINKLRVEKARATTAMRQTASDNAALRANLQAMAPEAQLPDDGALARLFALPLPPTPSASDDIVTLSEAARNSRVEQAEAAMRHARRSGLPSFSLGYAHAYEDATHFNGLTIGIGLPSYGLSRERRADAAETLATRLRAISEGAEENARRRSLEARIESLKAALADLEPAVNGVTAADLNAGNTSTPDGAVTGAVQQQLLQKALKGGQISVLDYINESNYLISAIMDCIDLRAEILQSIALLRPLTEPAD